MNKNATGPQVDQNRGDEDGRISQDTATPTAGTNQADNRFVAKDYGEMLAVLNDLELVSFDTDGGYQGEYKAVLTDGERLFYFFDSYGSCSGCDWLEDKRDWDDDTVSYQEARDAYGDLKPKYIVPKDQPLNFKPEEYEGFALVSDLVATDSEAIDD